MKKKKDRLPPFVAITKEMINSEAFKKLTNASRVTYLLLKAQCKKFEQDEVKFPYSHASAYMKTNTFAKSIAQLIEYGFISKTQEGGLFRRTNIYKLISEWKAYPLAYSIRATEKGSVKRYKIAQTTTENGSVKTIQ